MITETEVKVIPSLLTIKQFSTKYPAFKESSLRWIIFNEAHNGFSKSIVRFGRRILIDEKVFFSCLEAQNDGA